MKREQAEQIARGYSSMLSLGDAMCHEAHGDKPGAATRRAVVRAAASIGRQMTSD